MTVKILMQDWEITVKESILSVYYDNLDIQNHKDNQARNLLILALSILRKENQRKGVKRVRLSREIQNNPLFIEFQNEINEIKCNFENGLYEQNFRRLSEQHQKSSINRDTMLDVMNVEHFHLGNSLENNYRSKELLFVKYSDDTVYFIDVFTHHNFLDDKVLQILHNNWENVISVFKFSPNIQFVANINNKSRYQLYKNNINCVYEIIDAKGQKHYYGTHGVMSNGEAMQDVNHAMFLQRDIEHFQNNIDFFTNLIYKELLENLHKSFTELNFLVVWLADFGVCFMEDNSNTYFVLQEDEIVFLNKRK